MVISINSAYEDCENFVTTWTVKNEQYVSGSWKDNKYDKNRTFVAGSADDCKDRTLRKYYDNNFYYDKKGKDDNYYETNYEHCCFLSYDNMESYEKSYAQTIELEKDTSKVSIFGGYSYYGEEYDTYLEGINGGDVKEKSETKITGKCMPLTEAQYKNIKDYILHMQFDNKNFKNLKIDCNADNLKFFATILSLFFLL